MHKSQSLLFNLTTALHVSGVTTTHPQEHKVTASTASDNHYTVINRFNYAWGTQKNEIDLFKELQKNQ